MMRYIKNWQVDLFAVPITLNHEGRDKAKSLHGIFITLLFAGFIVWFIYTLSKQMFSHQNPNTITFDTFKEIPDSIELNRESFPFAIGVKLPTTYNLAYFMDEEIYVPVIKLLVFTNTENADGTITKNRQIIDVDIEPCTAEHFGSAQDSVKTLPLSSLYCIKHEQTNLDRVELAGKEDLSTYKAFYIGIQKCYNTTTKTCKTAAEISEKLTRSWINIIYLQAAINPQNFTHPNQRFATEYTTMLSPSMLKSGIIKLNHLNVIDDDGWLFENKKVKSFVKVDSPVENFDLTPHPAGFLYSGVLELGQVVTTYERQYTRLQTVLAQIQGSAATVILALIIVLRPYSEVKFKETLINELFDVKVKKRDDPNANNNQKKSSSLKKRNSNRPVEQPNQSPPPKTIAQALEIKLLKKASKEVPQANGFSILGSDRPLKSPKDEQEGLKTNIRSLKKILTSIGNDSPAHNPISPMTFEKRALLSQVKGQDLSLDASTARKSEKGLSLAIEKPERIKLEAFSDKVSDGPDSPRNVSNISLKEEDGGGSPENSKKDCLSSPPMSPQNDTGIQGLIALEMAELKPGEEVQEEETQDEDNLNYESSKIDISIWEFFSSYIRKNEKTKEKFAVLDRGMKNVKDRMDILNIMKKFRELDKLKALLLEEDQLTLFNAMPKAEIRPDENETSTNDMLRSKPFSQRILKKSAFIEMNEKQEHIKQSYDNIQMKAKKSKIDYRLIELYNNMLLHKKN